VKIRGRSHATVDIPREAWTATFDEFSTVHEGWLVSLDGLASTTGAQHELDDLALLGVSVAVSGVPMGTVEIAAIA
jgi:hypothetical protein